METTTPELEELVFTKPVTDESIKNLAEAITKQPILAEKSFNEIFAYVKLKYCVKYREQYTSLLIATFEVFSKLHRVQNLISKMIPAVKTMLEANVSSKYTVQDLLPEPVLEHFSSSIIPMASWQVINLMKTLAFHLDAVINDELINVTEDHGKVLYIHYVCVIVCQLLSSMRVAEHTVSNLVVEKVVKMMEDLKVTLNKFGTSLVNMEHNPHLMDAFLNLSYTWAELYIILSYYSIDGEVTMKFVVDNDYSACNVSYIHSYLSVDQWHLISERIANFGEKPCKNIMEKLIVQKLRAMTLFQDEVNEEINNAVINSIPFSEKTYEEIQSNFYLIKKFLPKMKLSDIMHLANVMIENAIDKSDVKTLHLDNFCHDELWTRALIFTSLSKINKIFKKQKRKLNVDKLTFTTTKIFRDIPEDGFVYNNLKDKCSLISETFISELLESKENVDSDFSVYDSLEVCFNIIKSINLIYFEEDVQTVVFLYLSGLLLDLNRVTLTNKGIKIVLENILLGMLQHGKVNLSAIKLNVLNKFIVENISNYKTAFDHVLSNLVKREDATGLEASVAYLVNNLKEEKYLQCSLLMMEFFNKFRKLKNLTPEDKVLLTDSKKALCNGIANFILEQNDPSPNLIESYAIVLKYMLNVNSDEKNLQILDNLKLYIETAINTNSGSFIKGKLMLFTVILINKTKLDVVNDELIIDIWKNCSNLQIKDEFTADYGKLMLPIFEHVSNDKFSFITTDLLNLLNEAKNKNHWFLIHHYLQIMNFVVQCNFNPIKSKIWEDTVEFFLQDLATIFSESQPNKDEPNKDMEKLFDSLATFGVNIIQSTHHLLSPIIIDMLLISCALLMTKSTMEFEHVFTSCINILEAFLKYRKPLIMDRLPSYLQQYRLLLRELVKRSKTTLDLDVVGVQQISNCAHQMEKLTKVLGTCSKDMARIAPYIICDFLKEFEQVSMYPSVKMHLNTCVYSMLSLCDKHAMAYISRITTCVEIFKNMVENSSKFRYKGKI